MPTYRVTTEVLVRRFFIIEADDEDDAAAIVQDPYLTPFAEDEADANVVDVEEVE